MVVCACRQGYHNLGPTECVPDQTPGCTEDSQCTDPDPCTVDECDPDSGRCINRLELIPDAEGLDVSGSCQDGADNDCDRLIDLADPDCGECANDSDCVDGNPCTLNQCNSDNHCETTLAQDGAGCDDLDPCTQTDGCLSGFCQGTDPTVCTAQDQCHQAGDCDPVTGLCSNPLQPDGTGCDDGNPCTDNDVCTSGTCAGEATAQGGGAWAVGDLGTILFWDGGQWNEQDSTTIEELWGGWAFGPEEAWAVGEGGSALHWTGSAWANEPGMNSTGFEVWATGPSQVLVANYHGLSEWGGAAWTDIDPPNWTGDPLVGVFGFSTDDLWVVGYNGIVMHKQGGGWTVRLSGVNTEVRDVWGALSSDVWIVGYEPIILRWNGTDLDPVANPANDKLHGVYGFTDDNVWVVGNEGLIINWKGDEWLTSSNPPAGSLRSVWGCAPDDIWTVGEFGMTQHFDGVEWTVEPTQTNARLNEVFGYCCGK
jgi:hypothetical protein